MRGSGERCCEAEWSICGPQCRQRARAAGRPELPGSGEVAAAKEMGMVQGGGAVGGTAGEGAEERPGQPCGNEMGA
ncbi:hypothetical protein TSOC_009988 [Tetrabaena socialis]|uniref:Uncharacterized protein n=1 Tax=Tetrabaena socialis TaxID=47790 RepID=A0A2J7ZUF6_9CHLO|nr:hypothetical protein TSOC_009988 [Tetrabaena socialis]|eukprot:PNH03906.1 hypothetical protein TSOC_009988 [Tetrabaena socialis]